MFSLIRRFSGSVVPRPDRPWPEDPTSNAPRVGAKRRMADEDRDEDDEQARLKKVRGATAESQGDAGEGSSTPLPQANETPDVKEVTAGVKEVELGEKPQAVPESIPLPEEKAGELESDASSTASTPPPAGEPSDAPDDGHSPTIVPETASGDPHASAEAVSEPAAVDAKEPQPPTDASDAIAVDADADAPGPAEARPIKKLPKPKTTTEEADSEAAPVES
ncbi:hypothetical protein C8R47DRAFT_1171449 [Mycena vitilis]|nr:hypothetical protein C8R47DRAFT_1171449 [Mycena vitilis]